MSTWINVKRVARYGLISFVRNGFVSLAAVLIMTITLFVVAGLFMFGAALSSTLKELTEKVDVTVYFTTAAPEEEVLAIRSSLEALPEVAAVTYVSREEALAAFRERHKNDQLTIQALEKFLEEQQGSGAAASIDKVNFYQNKTAIDRLTNIIETSRRLGIGIALVLGIATLLISFNTIRLAIYTAREEIGVMNIVGAGHWYVRGPFMVAGVLYGLVSGLVVLLLLYPLTLSLGPGSERFFGTFNVFAYFVDAFPLLFLIVMGSGVGLGALSSYLAVRRYLRA